MTNINYTAEMQEKDYNNEELFIAIDNGSTITTDNGEIAKILRVSGYAESNDSGIWKAIRNGGVEAIKNGYPSVANNLNTFRDLIKEYNNCNKNFSWTATWFGDVDYRYSGVIHYSQEMPEILKDMARNIEELLGYPDGYYNSCLANYFNNNSKGIGYHADDESIFINNGRVNSVACVSIGAMAKINFKNNLSNREQYLKVNSGDIYVMPEGKYQLLNKHKVTNMGKRVSLTFRRTNT